MFGKFGKQKESEKEKGAKTARNPSLERLKQAEEKLNKGKG